LIDRAVYVRIKGGLGNQMFQYAAGLALARHHGCPLKLDLSYCATDPLRDYALDGFGLVADVATPEEVSSFAVDERWRRSLGKAIGRRDLLLRPGLYVEPHFHVDETFFDHAPPVFLDGYWQSARYFETVAEDVRAAFPGPAAPSPRYEEMRARILELDEPVSIHVRLGDYVTGKASAKMAGSCTPDYYRSAVDLMRRLVPEATFVLFSDEPEEAAKQLAFADPIVAAGDPDRPAEDMALMSACRHHVIANSSFSWWGAWRGRNPDRTVVAPRLWFAPAYLRKAQTHDLYDEDWITLG
jgi:hypothetical protein